MEFMLAARTLCEWSAEELADLDRDWPPKRT